MSNTLKKLTFKDKNITLLGTAHISNESIEEVKNAIKETSPDCVAIELDEKRKNAIKNPENYSKLDIIAVLKRKEGFLLLANLILSSFQKRMGKNVGVKPGDEMLCAIDTADELGIKSVMVDRPISITLRRAWAKNSFWGKIKLLSALIASVFDKEEISEEQIEELKKSNELDSMMKELSEYLPTVKEVLINERDKYLATNIWNSPGKNIIAVLGAGHLPGVQTYLNNFSEGSESQDIKDISEVPPKTFTSKILAWIIPILIIMLIFVGFLFGGRSTGTQMFGSWILWNSILSSIGALIAGGHPLTIITAALASPITSLTPVLGVGMFTGIVQAFFCKPKVSDMETLQVDVSKFTGWYKNRILRVLLVFLLSSLGSSIGTFVAGANIIKSVSDIFNNFI